MNSRVFGLIALALVLLLAGALINGFQLWSLAGNYTVPWFCCAMAIAILLLLMTSLITGHLPASIPLSRVVVVIAGSSLAVGLGMFCDAFSYRGNWPLDWQVSAAEWVGFTGILIVLFWIPRSSGLPKPEKEMDQAKASSSSE